MRRGDGHHSALLGIRATEGLLDGGSRLVPIDLREHLVHVALLGHQDRTLAVWHRLEELHCQAAGAHLGCKPHPALAVILNFLSLVHPIADAALAHKHGALHLLNQALDANRNVLLAHGSRRWALPHPRVALESLLCELAMEELHNQLRDNPTLGRIATTACGELRVEVLDVG